MATRIHTAHTFTDLPRTAAMGWAGDLEPYRASVITRAARQVGHEQLSEFEARLHHGDITELPGSRVKTRAGLIATRLAPAPRPRRPRPGHHPGERGGPGGAGRPRAMQAGLTKWDALLPTDSSLSMCAAIDTLAAQYRSRQPAAERGSVPRRRLGRPGPVRRAGQHHRHPHHPHHRRPGQRAGRHPRNQTRRGASTPASTAPSSQASRPGPARRDHAMMGPAPRRHARPRSRPAPRTVDQPARRATPIPSRPVIGRGAPGG